MSFKKLLQLFPQLATAPFCPSEVKGSIYINEKLSFHKKLFLYIGPGLLVAIGYMDPGNWETGIEAGAKYGYKLLFVVLLASISAMFIQILSAKLGFVTGKTLAENIREYASPKINFILWIVAELAIISTDIAEVLGCALALNLLFHIPLLVGIFITAFDTFIVLGLKGRGFRTVEAIILCFIIIIIVSCGVNLILAQPKFHDIISQFIPEKQLFSDKDALLLSIGIIGATIMPHNLYLHSSLVQIRKVNPIQSEQRKAFRFICYDTIISLSIALLVNMGIVILSGTLFYFQSHNSVSTIEDAHKLLSPLLGTTLGSIIFAVGLLASGQSSTLTGTISAQVVLEGHMQWKIPCYLRRLITRSCALIPAFVGILILGEKGLSKLLFASQFCLGLMLPFVMFPLIVFTSQKKVMNHFRNSYLSIGFACGLFLILIACNVSFLSSLF